MPPQAERFRQLVPASIGSPAWPRCSVGGRVHSLPMIDITPNPVAFAFGTIEVRWYGIAYVLTIMAGAWLTYRLAARRGERTDIIPDGLIVIAVAALLGGRAYHVIDQWAYYKDHLAQIVLPPYSGLGIYGGLLTGLFATLWYVRRKGVSFWRWADIIAPAILLAQAVGRWGNFMNQELYGPPTNLPWGIAIECQYRVQEFLCPGTPADAHFIPLFFYESLLSLIGVAVMLLLWSRFTARGKLLIVGDVGMLYFVWYGLERSLLETFRFGYNWTFFGIPMAQVVGLGAAVAGLTAIVIRHWWVRRHPDDEAAAALPEPDAGEQSETAAA
jgi:phosphatidylglycerol---prolipoprotein diacylglyceryl transferase